MFRLHLEIWRTLLWDVNEREKTECHSKQQGGIEKRCDDGKVLWTFSGIFCDEATKTNNCHDRSHQQNHEIADSYI